MLLEIVQVALAILIVVPCTGLMLAVRSRKVG
jgi:hypothetical protein